MTDTDRHADRQASDDDRWVTVSQAALTVGVSERRIRRWIATGRLPARDGDGRRLVSLAAVRRMTDTDRQPAVTVIDTATVADGHAGRADGQPSELTQALAFIERQQQIILELSGRCGFLQARVQELERENLLLKAPVPRSETLASKTAAPSISKPDGPDSPVEAVGGEPKEQSHAESASESSESAVASATNGQETNSGGRSSGSGAGSPSLYNGVQTSDFRLSKMAGEKPSGGFLRQDRSGLVS